jgi:hypothetical protein
MEGTPPWHIPGLSDQMETSRPRHTGPSPPPQIISSTPLSLPHLRFIFCIAQLDTLLHALGFLAVGYVLEGDMNSKTDFGSLFRSVTSPETASVSPE